MRRSIVKRYLRRKTSEGLTLEEFKERTREMDNYDEIGRLANDHFEIIGSGQEATVYDVGPDRVMKISWRPGNLESEYRIFSDPSYQLVTPEAYDRHPQFEWIILEKVWPLERWGDVWVYFPEFSDRFRSEEEKMFGEGEGLTRREAFLEILDDFERWKYNPFFTGLPSDVKEWFEQVVELFDALHADPRDVRPANLGVDQDRNLVLLDISL